MADDRGPGARQAHTVEKLAWALLVALLVTACAPAERSASAVEPAPTPSAPQSPLPTPRASAAAELAPSIESATPVPQPVPQTVAALRPPSIRLIPAAFPLSKPQPLVEISLATLSGAIGTRTEQTAQLKQLDQWWWPEYVKLLNRVASGDTPEMRSQFAQWHVGTAYGDRLRPWLYGPEGQRTFEAGGLVIDRILGKPWGRLAMVEARMTLIAHIPRVKDQVRVLRVRLIPQPQGSWYVLDAYDEAARRWRAGDAPLYSIAAIEKDLPSYVGGYLWNESYVRGGQKQYPINYTETRFWSARRAAIEELNARFAGGALVDRHFEDLTLQILRFDDTTFLGDGVATVRLAGTLVEVDGKGTKTSQRFTQLLKFYRQSSAFAVYYPVDAQEDDGSWDSGGDLALGLVDRRYG